MLHIISKKPLKRWTEYSITEKDELLKELRKTKERGYAIAKEEMALGIIAIGAPIFNMESMKVIGSVCFDLVTSGHSLRSVEENYADLIMSLSRSISNMISVS
jgi:DNA-binding IclR family transcriptional regulator